MHDIDYLDPQVHFPALAHDGQRGFGLMLFLPAIAAVLVDPGAVDGDHEVACL